MKEKIEENKKQIPIFFAVDDKYIPFMAVALKSLIENSSKENEYIIKILYTNISEENKKNILEYSKENYNIDIEFVNMNGKLDDINDKLYTRDYFSNTTYYRLLLPELYPEYKKALYLDSDIVILKDIAKLYDIDLGDNLIGAAPDDVIQTLPEFRDYAELVVGVRRHEEYFNAGVMLMNLEKLREVKFKEKFVYMLGTIKFAVAQDQDYLNRICKGRVKLISKTWDRMPVSAQEKEEEDVSLVHYNLTFKPWHFDKVPYDKYFWKYAKETKYYNKILKIKANYSEEDIKRDSESHDRLVALAQKEVDCVGDDRK